MHQGIDISAYQDSTPIDYAKAVADLRSRGGGSTPFALVKLGEGSGYLNPDAERDIDGFRNAGAKVYGYWFFHPGVSVGEQIDLVKAHRFGVEMVWADVEVTDGLPMNLVAQAADNFLTGLKWNLIASGLYSNPDYLSQEPGAPWGHDLWLAEWGPSRPDRPCTIWQTGTGLVDGIAGQVDLDIYEGVFADEPKPAPPAPKPEPPKPEPKPEPTAPAGSEDVPQGSLRRYRCEVQTDNQGQGYLLVGVKWANLVGVSMQGSDPDPAADGVYWHGRAAVQDRDGDVLVSVTGARPSRTVVVYLTATVSP